MAFDGATGQLLMFGGSANTSSGLSDETWLWSGTRWSLLSPPVSPSARMYPSVAYDAATRQLILTGGYTNSGSGPALADTWDWTGSTWVQLSPATTPSAEFGGSLAYDPDTGDLVRFGGNGGYGGDTTSETYVWNGSDWSRPSPAHSPPARWDACMGWDPATGQFLLYGGQSSNGGGALDGVWVWTGSDWSDLVPEGGPLSGAGARYGAAMAFSADTGEMVVFGGFGAHWLNDTWTWTGSGWSQLAPATSPSPRADAAYAADPATGQILLYGGKDGSGRLSDTWAYVGTPNTSQSTATTTATSRQGVRPTSATTVGSRAPTGPAVAGPAASSESGGSAQSGMVAVAPTRSPKTPTGSTTGRTSSTTVADGAAAPQAVSAKPVANGGEKNGSGSHGLSVGFLVAGIAASVLLIGAAGAGIVVVRRRRQSS